MLNFMSSHIIMCSAISDSSSQIGELWQEKSLKTPDPLFRTCGEGLRTRLAWNMVMLSSCGSVNLRARYLMEACHVTVMTVGDCGGYAPMPPLLPPSMQVEKKKEVMKIHRSVCAYRMLYHFFPSLRGLTEVWHHMHPQRVWFFFYNTNWRLSQGFVWWFLAPTQLRYT